MKKLLPLLLASFFSFPAFAQTEVEEEEENTIELSPLYEEMLPSTAQVLFIDSLVVPKDEFLSRIPLTATQGRMEMKDGNVFYVNEFNSKRIVATTVPADSVSERHLFITNRDGRTWSQPRQLQELETFLDETDYPFLLADGVTLYFAGKGEGSVGGYDIFRTSYDAEDFTFLEPRNMGLPYNSMANEYFMAINDQQNLGWLVSDRNQPEGMVCIYTFEPVSKRVNHDPDTDEDVLLSFAEIRSISDTWSFGNREAALKRVDELNALRKAEAPTERVFFVVNDQRVYTSLSDFKSKDGAKKYQEIATLKKHLLQYEQMLDIARDSYRAAKNKAQLAKDIEANEQQILAHKREISKAEKALRAAELQAK